jgi:hypothetical protein
MPPQVQTLGDHIGVICMDAHAMDASRFSMHFIHVIEN